MKRKKILITGAGGQVSSRMVSALKEKYDLVLTDKTKDLPNIDYSDEIIPADILNENRDTYRHLFKDIDAVVHGARIKNRNNPRNYADEKANIQMAYNIYQTCVEENVKRAVILSSNHATDFYERLIHKKKMLAVTPDMAPYSDNFYGWAKICIETLGFLFATGEQNNGQILENIQLRIGAPREIRLESIEKGDIIKMNRSLGAYLSARDQIQLVEKSIDTEDVTDEHGNPFQIFYGISDNSHAFWDTSNARKIIGYEPQDDSSIRFSEQVRRITK